MSRELHPRTQFVSGLDLSGVVQTGLVKKFHRKSRNGCSTCRVRRVKCDEEKPSCSNCRRKDSNCIYERNWIVSKRPAGAYTLSALPEKQAHSEDRNTVELHLLQFYINRAGPSIPFDQASSHELWVEVIPRMALKSKALLYSVFAITSLYQTKHKIDTCFPDCLKGLSMEIEHETYAQLAFEHHRRDLSRVCLGSIDSIFITANTMRLMAFVVLSTRSLKPYCPPIEWLRIVKSHWHLYGMAWQSSKDDPSTQTSRLARTTPIVWQANLPTGSQETSPLGHLLHALHQDTTIGSDEDNPEEWDAETRDAYTVTLKYICDTLQSVQRQESFGSIARSLMLFPVVIPDHFIRLVALCKPRAIVILAHYFALLTLLQHFWYIGDTGIREVEAALEFLPQRWRSHMRWPLRVIATGRSFSAGVGRENSIAFPESLCVYENLHVHENPVQSDCL
ncbi:hypothetical protein C7974DRAFT_17902 [Boeremia exigua]|uniref:uncharacterized protein n=1 Tax=Boeremia exigua TaxID=749465 RepID=UPI001E8DF224|nr:uncharacterized protein C7974DRAFT_17902 [Boeremia exigua]KAH6644280.1 hypothetical protein C7974DRAFT_17902 [Boeremia exigua]